MQKASLNVQNNIRTKAGTSIKVQTDMINKLQSADLHRKWTPLQAVARFSNPID
jgi:hypothetical protein